jgi:hypothetical protein
MGSVAWSGRSKLLGGLTHSQFSSERKRSFRIKPVRPGEWGWPHSQVEGYYRFTNLDNNTNWAERSRWLAIELPIRMTAKEMPS